VSETSTARSALSTRDVAVARPIAEFVRAINMGDVDLAVAQLAPDALHHGTVSNYTPEGVRVLFTMLREVFPDLHLDVRQQQVQGNRVLSRIVATGTHTGSYLGKPATGQPVAWESVDIAEVEAHGSVEVDNGGELESDYYRVLKRFWDLWSDPELFKRIGFIPGIMC
jgi:predicted ester cyclase